MTTYRIIGTPQIEASYCDDWDTVITVNVERGDGTMGRAVWLVVGVPDYQRSTALAATNHNQPVARSYYGLITVRVFGDSPDCWCPESFDPEDAKLICCAAFHHALEAHDAYGRTLRTQTDTISGQAPTHSEESK